MSSSPKHAPFSIGPSLAPRINAAQLSIAAEQARLAGECNEFAGRMESLAREIDSQAASALAAVEERSTISAANEVIAEFNRLEGVAAERRWFSDSLRAVRELIDQLIAAVDAGDLVRVRRLVNDGGRTIAQVVSDMSEAVAVVARETVVIEVVESALRSLGMSVIGQSKDPGGSRLLVSASAGGPNRVAVETNRLVYSFDDLTTQQERTGGRVSVRCDDTVELLAALHTRMAEEGIVVGSLDWKGRPSASRLGPLTFDRDRNRENR